MRVSSLDRRRLVRARHRQAPGRTSWLLSQMGIRLGSGIVAAGMGSKLVTDAAVKAGDWAGIEANVRRTVEAIAAFRASR